MRKENIASVAFETIRKRILNFQLLPGVKVSDDEMAREFGTSRTPIREALNRLSENGLVDLRPRQGFTVKVFSRKEMEDLYALRETLERLAVDLAIKHMDKEKEKALTHLLDTYPSIMKSGDLALFNDADERFHDLIGLYSGNEALYGTLRNLQGKIRIMRRYDHLRSSSFQESYEEHLRILDCMRRREVNKAKREMSRHIRNSMRFLSRALPD